MGVESSHNKIGNNGRDSDCNTKAVSLNRFSAVLHKAYYRKAVIIMESIINAITTKAKQEMKTPIEIALGVDDNGMTTAKKLYEFLELNPKNYSHWCKANITDNEFATENEDYEVFVAKDENPLGGRPTQDYKLTAHFAKKLSCKGNGEKAEQAREYFSRLDDKTKDLAQNFNDLSPELRLLISMELKQKQQDKEIIAIREEIKSLEAKVTTHNDDYFTISGYASLRGLNVDINRANMLGRKASKLSREYGYEISRTKDVRFGTVNTYHIDILKEVFKR